jgi:hypothetical protein
MIEILHVTSVFPFFAGKHLGPPQTRRLVCRQLTVSSVEALRIKDKKISGLNTHRFWDTS